MRKPILFLALAVAALLAPLPLRTLQAQTVGAATDTTPGATARVIVKYKADSALARKAVQALTPQQAQAQLASQAQLLGQRVGIALRAGLAVSERSQVVFASDRSSEQLAARLAAEPDIEYAVPDQMRHIVAVPNDPLYPTRAYNNGGSPTAGGPLVGQWYLKPPGAATASPTSGTSNTAPAAINAEQAWDITTGDPSIVVAVLDTGIRFDHADFRTVGNGGNLLPGYDMIAADSDGSFTTANDGDGRDADPSDPGDFVLQSDVGHGGCVQSDVSGHATSSWHGTQTTGLIGAVTQNATGMASVGRNVSVLPVRVIGKCGGFDSDITAGILWAAGYSVPGVPDNLHPARVINISLGGSGSCSFAYIDAVAQANAVGTVVVAAAGNSEGHAVSVPANCPGVIGVTALRHIGTKVGFSDLGSQIAISAPGGNCVNTAPGTPCLYAMITTSNSGATTPVANGSGGSIYTDAFNSSLGTSFSSPLVAGTAALMLSAQPQLQPDEVRFKIQQTARAFPTATVDETNTPIPMCAAPSNANQDQCVCTAGLCGAGMLDTHAAVLSAAGVQARISVTPANPNAGDTVTLDSAGSLLPAGHTIASYSWALTNGGGIVTGLVGSVTAPTVMATPHAGGSFVVTLTETDNTGAVAAEQVTVTVTGAPPPPSGGGGGGGGGALDFGWLLALAAAVLALIVLRTRHSAP